MEQDGKASQPISPPPETLPRNSRDPNANSPRANKTVQLKASVPSMVRIRAASHVRRKDYRPLRKISKTRNDQSPSRSSPQRYLSQSLSNGDQDRKSFKSKMQDVEKIIKENKAVLALSLDPKSSDSPKPRDKKG